MYYLIIYYYLLSVDLSMQQSILTKALQGEQLGVEVILMEV